MRWQIEHTIGLRTPLAFCVWARLELFVLLHAAFCTCIEIPLHCQYWNVISLDLDAYRA